MGGTMRWAELRMCRFWAGGISSFSFSRAREYRLLRRLQSYDSLENNWLVPSETYNPCQNLRHSILKDCLSGFFYNWTGIIYPTPPPPVPPKQYWTYIAIAATVFCRYKCN
jgi:hypothetical protein